MKKRFVYLGLSSAILMSGTLFISEATQAEENDSLATVEVKASQSGEVKFKDIDTSANIIFQKLDLTDTDIGAKTQLEFIDVGKEAAKIFIEDTRKNYPAGTTSTATVSIKADDKTSSSYTTGMLANKMTLKLQPKSTQASDGVSITKTVIELDEISKNGGSFIELPYTDGSTNVKAVTLDPELHIPAVENLTTNTYGTTLTWTLDTSKL